MKSFALQQQEWCIGRPCLQQRLHGKRPEVQRRCGRFAMAMTALRGNAVFHQHIQRALNRAWLRSVARAQHRQRNSRSAIAMSSQYLIGNARYQGRAWAEFESPFHSARFRGMSRNWLNGDASLESPELDFDPIRIGSKSNFLFEHDLFRKPVTTFRDHALEHREAPLLEERFGLRRQQILHVDRRHAVGRAGEDRHRIDDGRVR